MWGAVGRQVCGGRAACGGRAVDVQRACSYAHACSYTSPGRCPGAHALPLPARPRSINHRAGRATLFHVWSIADLYGILTPFWPVGEMPTCDWFSVLISNAVTSLKTGSF